MNSYSQKTPENGNGNGRNAPFFSETPESEIHLRDYLRVFSRGKWIIAACFILVMVITVWVTFTTEPVYQANVRLMLEEKAGMGESLFDFTSMMKKETMLNNQVEILNSRSLSEDVVRELVRHPDSELLVDALWPEGDKGLLSFLSTLRSGETDTLSEQEKFDARVNSFREGHLNVKLIRETDVIDVEVQAQHPVAASIAANTVFSVYKRMNREESQAEVREVSRFLREQLSRYEDELQSSEQNLKQYQESANVIALDRETEELVKKIAEFESLYNEAKTEYQSAQQRLAYIDKKLGQQNKKIDMETISSKPYLEELKRQIAEKEARLAMFLSDAINKGRAESVYTQKEVDRLTRQIDAIKNQFKEEVMKIAAAEFIDPSVMAGSLVTSKIEIETEIQALQPKVSAFERILERYNNELESLPEKKLRLARLERQAQVSEKIYIMLQEKYQESRITEVGQLGNVRVIDPAKPPRNPIKPKKKLNLLLGAMLGLGLGVGIAFFREYMDDSINNLEELEAMNLTLVSMIPYIKPEHNEGAPFTLKNADPEVQNVNERLVTHLRPKSPVSEAYRSLRTNLIFSAADQPRKTILMTSSGPREGKSTTVSNLAITFAQMGTKTLLIDADLRRPMLYKLFRLNKEPGLTNVLIGKSTLSDAVQTVNGLSNLDFLMCGTLPPNPAELLGSEKMRHLLEEAKQSYDMALIDCPPVIAVTDPTLLSNQVDGVLLVVKSGEVQRQALDMAVKQLRRVEAPLVGVVMNSVKTTNFYNSSYYYQYYHYYDTDRKKQKSRRRKRTHPA
ncbi:MAG: polysaccharide biosynthesis tyrosine autokinase [candidate division KSB1 bacterium]|nr:polysaccharide biosynthesis tyrosine autokinase [candidate division KSB1 bacterium]